MDCRRVEELIPLYVEGDLREPHASHVRAHAQTCERCGGLVAQYEGSQAWLRAESAPEFDEAFVDTVRAGVMREISAISMRRPFVERLRDWIAPRRVILVTAALLIVFIALASFIYLSRLRVNRQDAGIAKQTPAPPVEREVERAPTPSDTNNRVDPQPKRRMPHRAAPLLANRSRREVRRVKTTPDNALAQTQPAVLPVAPFDRSSAATETEERLRIEIQTADPNIRIIWFAPKPTDTDAP